MIKAGIVGATGYTGVELLRLLAGHSEVSIQTVTSRSEAGKAVSNMFPSLRGVINEKFCEPSIEQLSQCDVVFFATPNGTAMNFVPELIQNSIKVIDLSADFRIKDARVWQQWYGMSHSCPELLSEAVYGLPEVNREHIKGARILANPGCYPTATQLGFIPLLKNNLVNPDYLIADVKSGVSGAGRKAAINYLQCESSESMKAYGLSGHRHQPEIVQGLNEVSEQPVRLTFVPHLTPMIRGIQTSLYAQLINKTVDIQKLFENFYKDEPFVDVLESGMSPDTKNVRGTNNCHISIIQPQYDDSVVVLAAEDNLVKGAAGQAIQNMNLMFGLNETAGLKLIAAIP